MSSCVFMEKGFQLHRIGSFLRRRPAVTTNSLVVFVGLILILLILSSFRLFHSNISDMESSRLFPPLSMKNHVSKDDSHDGGAPQRNVLSTAADPGGSNSSSAYQKTQESPNTGGGKGSSDLAPIPLEADKKGLRQGVKFYEYSPASEREIKHHRIKTLLFVFYGTLPNPVIHNAITHVAQVFAKYDILHVAVAAEYLSDFQFFLGDNPEDDVPFAMIVEANNGWRKYKMSSPIEEKTLEEFEGLYFQAKLQPFLRSESIVAGADDGKRVKHIVSTEFRQRVTKSKRDSLVFFYAPWCGHCKRFEPKFHGLAQKFKDILSIDFLKMDVTKNDVDHPNVTIQRVPYVRFFKSGAKLGEPVIFDHTRLDVEEYGTKFLTEHASCEFNLATGKDCYLGEDIEEL